MSNKIFNFQLPEELMQEFKKIADRNCLSMSAQLRTLLIKFIKENKGD